MCWSIWTDSYVRAGWLQEDMLSYWFPGWEVYALRLKEECVNLLKLQLQCLIGVRKLPFQSLHTQLCLSYVPSHSCFAPLGCLSLSPLFYLLLLCLFISFCLSLITVHCFSWAARSCNPTAKNQTVLPADWLARKETEMLTHTHTLSRLDGASAIPRKTAQ